MGLKSKKILGISVTTSPKKEILEDIGKYLEKSSVGSLKSSEKHQKPLIIVTPNPEQIVLAQEDRDFARILNQADVALPDGEGLVVAIRLLGQSSVVRRIAGVEFMEDLVVMASLRGYTVGLIGGRGGVAVKALECLRRKYPRLNGWADESGDINNSYNDYNYYNCYKKLKETNTRLVFVGLGAPKQEYFIEEMVRRWLLVHRKTENVHNAQRTNELTHHSLVLMAVGGSFDIISGRMPRAPAALRAVGLEWLWRLIRQPWRWRRQLRLLQFLWLVVREKLAF